MRIAIIPARGGSKRIKKKNIIDFEGHPMISYPLAAASKSGVFDKIHVSTDDPEITNIVTKLGYTIDFPRPNSLADDHTPVLEVARYVLETYRQRGETFDSFAMIMPCSPLLEAEDLVGAFRIFDDGRQLHPVLSVSEFPAPTEWAFAANSDGTISVEKPELLAIRSQDLKEKFYDTGTVFIQTSEEVLQSKAKTLSKFYPYKLPKERSVDIDSIEDLKFAAYLKRASLARG